MAKFSEIEKRLLERIPEDSSLRTSLSSIREATEKIWANDAPRIVQDYTDHGIAHSERLAGFAGKLLEASEGSHLSAEEMYLLLGGIYLHDIGMQCDVVKFPDIKSRAENMGAKFAVKFTAKLANRYSIDEQKDIRKNHQYLAGAWIDYAFQSNKTVLSQAAKSIPDHLVGDLIDVCKYHSKLPITVCPKEFVLNSQGRKQFVAALLRFADELDIDGPRVSLETVKTFSLPPHNRVYWWLHNHTKVVFSDRNVIELTIRLNPADMKLHDSFVHAAFITEFQTKNHPVITVLAQNSIPIIISAQSKVIAYEYTEPLPAEIVQALQAMQEKADPLAELSGEICIWLRAIRYEISEPQQRDDRSVDMLVTLDQGTLKQRVLVRCIDGEVSSSDVEELDRKLDRKTPQGWLISDKRVSSSAQKAAAREDALRVFNLSDFLQQMVWNSYFDILSALVKKSCIPELYVDLACYKHEMDEGGKEKERDEYASLDKYVDNWLKERGKMHISLLGEFGTGKTWFCRHYAYRQLQRYIQDPAGERLPLLITLRAFAKAMTPQQLINDALLDQYRLPFVGGAFEVFQEINRCGKLLLLLDGFDEMARQVDYQTVVDNFWELAKLVSEDSKVILTSRTEYFHWAKESEQILAGKEYGRSTLLLEPPKFDVLNLEPFNDARIREAIIRRLGAEKGVTEAKRILTAPNLAEMARKPVLVELLLAVVNEVSADVLKEPAQVYLYATNKLLLRNIDTRRTFTSTAGKLFFLCELAWEMISSNELCIHYTVIPERIKSYFGNEIKDQHELDAWDFDLRAQTLLHRNAAGYYEFAHKSLAEYFVAFKFAAELGCLAPSYAQTYCEEGNRLCELPIEQKDIIGLAKTFGRLALTDERMKAVNELLSSMIAEDAAGRLWTLIHETKGKTAEQVEYVGGNAVTLLRMRGETFAEKDLASTILAGADFRGCQLSAANMQDCDLREANLIGSRFTENSFRSVKLQKTKAMCLGISKLDPSINSQFMGQTAIVMRGSDLDILEWRVNHGLRYYLFLILTLNTPFSWSEIRDKLVNKNFFECLAIYDEEIEAAKHYASEHSLTNFSDILERELDYLNR